MLRSSVDLPAPFGPTRNASSPASSVTVTLASTVRVPERFRYPAERPSRRSAGLGQA
jgi:hypothetical protein